MEITHEQIVLLVVLFLSAGFGLALVVFAIWSRYRLNAEMDRKAKEDRAGRVSRRPDTSQGGPRPE